MEKVLAYKVVLPRPEGAAGWRSSNARGKLELTYQIGERTTAKFGGVMCFRTLKDAKRFVRDNGKVSAEILKVEGHGEVPIFKLANPLQINNDPKLAKRFWNPRSPIAKRDGFIAPEGSIAFKSVVPLPESEI